MRTRAHRGCWSGATADCAVVKVASVWVKTKTKVLLGDAGEPVGVALTSPSLVCGCWAVMAPQTPGWECAAPVWHSGRPVLFMYLVSLAKCREDRSLSVRQEALFRSLWRLWRERNPLCVWKCFQKDSLCTAACQEVCQHPATGGWQH